VDSKSAPAVECQADVQAQAIRAHGAAAYEKMFGRKLEPEELDDMVFMAEMGAFVDDDE